MNIKKINHVILTVAAVVIGANQSTQAAISFVGVTDLTTDIGFAGDVSNSDLVNAGASSLASAPTYSAAPHFGGSPSATNNGTLGSSGATSEITFWLNASANDTFSVTFDFDTSVNDLGYTIDSIQTIHGWTSNSGEQKNQNYTVETSSVGSAAFNLLTTVAYNPFTSAGTSSVTSKVNITESTTAPLISGVDQIRFTYTVRDPAGTQGSPTIREIDVFGSPTVIPEPSSTVLLGLGALGLILRRRRI